MKYNEYADLKAAGLSLPVWKKYVPDDLDCSTLQDIRPLHTPAEFLPENSDLLDRACTNLVRDMVKNSQSRSTQVGGTHYTDMAIQPWDAARAWSTPSEYLGYHVITVNAYLARHRQKGGLQDIKKALHHLTELVRYFEQDEEYPY